MQESNEQDLQFYAHFCSKVIFKKSGQIPTAGVYINKKGKMLFMYSDDFINGLTHKQVVFLIIHELTHLLSDHQERTKEMCFEKELSNEVQDMIINSNIVKHFPKVTESPLNQEDGSDGGLYIPDDYNDDEFFELLYRYALAKRQDFEERFEKEKQQCNGFPGGLPFPDIDEEKGEVNDSDVNKSSVSKSKGDKKSDEENDDNDQGEEGQGKGGKGQEGSDEEDKKGEGQGKGEQQQEQEEGDDEPEEKEDIDPNTNSDKDFSNIDPKMDDVSKHHDKPGPDVPNWDRIFYNEKVKEEMEKRLGKACRNPNLIDEHLDDEVNGEYKESVVKNVLNSMRSRGLVSSNMEEYINNIRRRKKDWTKDVKRQMSPILRSNAKIKTYMKMNRKVDDLKGKKPMKGYHINCILDSSGSMSGMIESALSYIFRKDLHVNLVQCDADVQAINEIRSLNDFRNMKVKGFGGTVLQPAIDLLGDDQKMRKLNTIVLTDGMTDSLDLSVLKGDVLVISNHKKCPVRSENKGRTKQITIEERDL